MENEANSIRLKDFELICRVCLKFSDNLVPISEYEIINMMSFCTSVQIWLNDNLPNHLCRSCLTDLRNAFNFKQLSENSDSKLKRIVYEKEMDTEKHFDGNNFNDDLIGSLKSELESDSDIKIQNDFEVEDINIKNIITKREKLSLDDLKFHMKEYNPFEIKTESEIDNSNTKDFQCSKCNSLFDDQLHFEQHIETCKLLKPPVGERKKSKKNHKKVRQKLIHPCETCGEKFKTRAALKKHKVEHKPKPPYQCTYCDKILKSLPVLKNHIKIHTGHSVQAPCQVCGKQILKRNMKTHLEIHRKNRVPTKCKQCSKQFLSKPSLINHVRHTHKNVSKFTYLCNICGRGCASPGTLKIHMCTHSAVSQFECDQCPMKYKSPNNLRRHVLTTHLNVRKFVCPKCPQRFSLKEILVNHMRTHTGERPFQCIVCEKSYTQKAALHTHMKKAHID